MEFHKYIYPYTINFSKGSTRLESVSNLYHQVQLLRMEQVFSRGIALITDKRFVVSPIQLLLRPYNMVHRVQMLVKKCDVSDTEQWPHQDWCGQTIRIDIGVGRNLEPLASDIRVHDGIFDFGYTILILVSVYVWKMLEFSAMSRVVFDVRWHDLQVTCHAARWRFYRAFLHCCSRRLIFGSKSQYLCGFKVLLRYSHIDCVPRDAKGAETRNSCQWLWLLFNEKSAIDCPSNSSLFSYRDRWSHGILHV